MKKNNFFTAQCLLSLAIMYTNSSCIFVDSESVHTEDEDSFLMLPHEVVEFYYSPDHDGDRIFYTWHEDDDYSFQYQPIKVEFYWTDELDDYDDWHMWEKRYVEYGYKSTRERLYSDDKYIGYLMEYENRTNQKIRVHLIIEHEH